MTFQIRPLDPEPFQALFDQPDEILAKQGAIRMRADISPGYPCRVSLVDAPVGSSMLLLNHEHLSLASPYRARHAIFVREHAVPYFPASGEIPDVIASRLMAVRAYDADGMMRDAEIAEGVDLVPIIDRMFTDPQISFLQLHNARRGCFSAQVERA